MKISDNTAISMPMRNLIGLIVAIGVGIFAYSDVTQRLTQLETARQLMEADLLKAADQKPIDMEQTMLVEWLAKNQEGLQKEMESMMNNRDNKKTIIHDRKQRRKNRRMTGTNVDDEAVSVEDTSELLDSYIDATDTVLDKDKLKTNMRNLLTEAQALEVA